MKNKLDLNHKPEAYYEDLRSELIRFLPKNIAKVLDVGCGKGRFGKTLKDMFGSEVWGIEVYKEAANVAASRLDKIIEGNIEDNNLSLPLKYFDFIVLNDILEHLYNPWAVLNRIKVHLKDDGFILASIPNIRYFYVLKDLLFNKKWNYEDTGILDTTHLRFFTKDSIKEMFTNNGYNIVRIEGIKPTHISWKFKMLNALLLKNLDDTRFPQFACLAQKK